MKKVYSVCIALLIVLVFVTGCQQTPEKAAVAEKQDTEHLLEQARKETASSDLRSLSEQYSIPETYTYDAQGADGKLNINVNARVIVPESSALPIYRVRQTEFSQGTVSAYFQALCGDAEMWIDSGQQSKSQINDTIVKVKARIAQIQDDPQLSDELEMNKQLLAELEQKLKTAPDTPAEQRADGTLIKKNDAATDMPPSEEGDEPLATPKIQDVGVATGIEAYERYNGGTGRTFYVNNDGSPSIIYMDLRNPAAGGDFGLSYSLPVTDDSNVDVEMLSKAGLKPGEARQMVQGLLDKTDSGMAVDSVYLQDDAQYYDDGTVQPAENYAYLIYCVRLVDGLPCSYVTGESQPESDAMASAWRYEQMYFLVNGEGIFNMVWTCPIEVIETVSEDARLKPFSEIRGIFESMMMVKYEAQAENSAYDFDINRVTLSLHRIVEENSNESGLLVPAWNFYGKWATETDAPGLSYEYLGQSFLTVNAIDGSIIDIYKGY